MFKNLIFAQIGTTVGDIDGNVERILAIARKADPSSILVFPEMAITGYPPEDLILRPAFQRKALEAVDSLARATAHLPPILVGGLWMEEDRRYNTAFFLAGGRIVHKHYKVMLPNYGIFDERRIFNPGGAPVAFEYLGQKWGVLVCEDIWYPHMPRLLKAQNAEGIIVLNASPFEKEKHLRRYRLIRETSHALRLPIAYLNTCGAQDDVIFDGGSFACNAQGDLVFSLPQFEEVVSPVSTQLFPALPVLESVWRACVSGLKTYVTRNGFSGVVLGLSGGLDSAVVAAIAVDALGAENVTGVMLPSEFTSQQSMEDAQESSTLLGIRLLSIPIKEAMRAAGTEVVPAVSSGENWQSDLSLGGNLQARLRAVYLMAVSNKHNLMLVNTSNKSEIAVGYSTLYGDSCGGYAPLKDVYKTEVYALASWRNSLQPVIPERSISKKPTAELAPDQTDQDQLPPYEVLDAILRHYIEEQRSIDEIASSGVPKELVERIVRMIRNAEYKRRQAPPGAKVSSMEFIRDWRMPLTNGFKG